MKNYKVEIEVNGGEYLDQVSINQVESVEKSSANSILINGSIEISFGGDVVSVSGG